MADLNACLEYTVYWILVFQFHFYAYSIGCKIKMQPVLLLSEKAEGLSCSWDHFIGNASFSAFNDFKCQLFLCSVEAGLLTLSLANLPITGVQTQWARWCWWQRTEDTSSALGHCRAGEVCSTSHLASEIVAIKLDANGSEYMNSLY